jgi:hypothetical protein
MYTNSWRRGPTSYSGIMELRKEVAEGGASDRQRERKRNEKARGRTPSYSK